MVFDHTPLTPPLKHIYGPLIAIFYLQEMEHITYKNGFLLKKKFYIACKYAS